MIAPHDRITQSMLALWEITWPTRQESQPVFLQPLQKRAEWKEFEPCHGEFDRQRQAIQVTADLDDEWGLFIAQLKGGLDLPRSLEKENDRAIALERFPLWE